MHLTSMQHNLFLAFLESIIESSCSPGCGDVSSSSSSSSRKRSSESDAATTVNATECGGTSRRLTRLQSARDAESWRTDDQQCQTITAMKTSATSSIEWVGEFKLLQSDGTFVLRSSSLTYDWVVENFRRDFRRRCAANPNEPMTVQPGSSDSSLELTPCDTAPKCYFTQGGRENCAFMNTANVMHFIGDLKTMNAVLDLYKKGDHSTTDILHFLHDSLRRRPMCWQGTIFKDGMFDPLRNISQYPTIVQLCGEKSGIMHCVALCQYWIFDSNLPRALPLCRAGFDWCCSSSDSFQAYSYCYRAIRFFHHKPRQGWNLTLQPIGEHTNQCDKCRFLVSK